jgi:hypothetical protein
LGCLNIDRVLIWKPWFLRTNVEVEMGAKRALWQAVLSGAIKAARKAGLDVYGATIAPDGKISLTFWDAKKGEAKGMLETPDDVRKLL